MSSTKLSKDLIVPTFDYSGIDPEIKAKLICTAGEISRNKAFHIKTALKMGEDICIANDLMAECGRYGRFGEWVERECAISRTTAYNYMWAWQRFGKCEAIEQINDGAMYLLSAPRVPQAAIDEAADLAKKGVKITVEAAKKIIDSYRPKPPQKRELFNGVEQQDTAKNGVANLTPSNGKASTDVSFDVPAIEAKPAKPGRQKIKPADRKAALKAFGQLVRALDKMLISADVEQQMQDILHAIKGS